MPILLLTVLAAVLRFVLIGHQGFWYDESYSVYLVRLPPAHMLRLLPSLESTPPLYYCVTWVWARIFGFGPAAIKSLSAVCGTLTVPVAYAAARKLLANWRSALIVAALTAFNPLLVWYSQEARAYSMLVLLCACTVLALAYAREHPRALPLSMWALACALALLTHYYAVILVAPEAAWLLYEHRHARNVRVAIVGVIAVGGALLPLAIHQNVAGHNGWIASVALSGRLAQTLPLVLIGPETHLRVAMKFLAFAMVAVGIGLLIWRSRRRERQSALLPGVLALVGFLIAVIPGHSSFLTRNLLPIWLPAAMFLAAGLGAARTRLASVLGAGACAVLCAIGLFAVISVDATHAYQRTNWQPVARVIGAWPAGGTGGTGSTGGVGSTGGTGGVGSARGADTRIVVVQRNPGVLPLGLYLTGLGYNRVAAVPRVSEIDIVAVYRHRGLGGFCWWGSECNLVWSPLKRDYDIPGFRVVARRRVDEFSVLVLRSRTPRTVRSAALPSGSLIQRG